MASQILKRFVDWEEQFVSHDRGSRVVHYYLRDRHGQNSLAVVGTERSLRHMVYVVCDEFLPLAGLDKSTTSAFKWRARREVVEWLQSLLTKTRSGSSERYHSSGSPSTEAAESSDVDAVMEENGDVHESVPEEKRRTYHERDVRKQVNHSKGGVAWVGNAWSCRKRLRHFQSFVRNGITISVHDFVYVLTEEERHIAYVEDMYEDKKLRKKLRVRWFHKTNELACKIPPPTPHARELFYTSFPQVLCVECVDGLATVLSPEHFDSCSKMLPSESVMQMHVCSRQFDSSEGIKPFSIQDVKGYWHQQVLSYVGVRVPPGGEWSPPHTEPGSEDLDMDEEEEAEPGTVIHRGPRTTRSSRRRVGFTVRIRGGDAGELSTGVSSPEDRACSTSDGAVVGGEIGHVSSPGDARPPSTGRGDKGEEGVSSLEHQPVFEVGDRIEILSQDSGLRGCWFRGTIVRRVSRRLKVKYEELQNEDGKGNLEEWVSAWRLAGPDKLGNRVVGRTTVRPFPTSNVPPGDSGIGQAVDVWWNDGWWEGIVVGKESGGDVRVYFPGEGDTVDFKVGDLRLSKDWVNGSWIDIHCNPDAVKAANLSFLSSNCGQPISVEKKAAGSTPRIPIIHPRKSPIRLDTPSLSAFDLKEKHLEHQYADVAVDSEAAGKDGSDQCEERRSRPLREDVETLLHFVANCTEGEVKKEEVSKVVSENGQEAAIPQDASASEKCPALGSLIILSNASSNLVSSELKWKTARKRMRHEGDTLGLSRAEHRSHHIHTNHNVPKEDEHSREKENSMSDRENEGPGHKEREELPRWRTGDRSGESDDTAKLKKLRQGHDSSLKSIHGPPIGGTPLFIGTPPIANLVMSR